jgi:RNA polymerase sigma factor (sigma-70 family)
MVSACCPTTIDRWKLDLVRTRAFRLGFRGADLDDVQQDVLIEVLMFQFHPERANGANETTALISLIDRRLLMARRQRQRYQQRLSRIQQWTNPEDAAIDAEQSNHEERTARRMDVRELLTALTPEDKALCDALADGESIDSIAHRLQCSWHTVKRRIEHLRQLLVEMGVDSYVR